MSTQISVWSERPFFRAQRRAKAGAMAMSPRNLFRLGRFAEGCAENERTSVDLFFRRYVLLRRAISPSVTKARAADCGLSFSARRALSENRSRGRSASRTFFWLLRIVT